MKRLILIISAFAMLAASSCKKEHSGDSQSIVGNWRWVQSQGGIGGLTLTPQSTHTNFRNEFYADSSFKRFQNDSLIIQGRFSIIHNYKYTPSEIVDVLKVELANSSMLIRNDTLYTSDLFISDGFSNIYVRIK